MSNYRKKVRTLVVAALADATSRFNAKLAAVASGGDYDITPFTIDFTYPSRSFVMGYLTGESDVETSRIIQFPGATLHGATATHLKTVKFRKFSGQVVLVLTFWLRYRALTDLAHVGNAIDEEAASFNYEEIADAVEDAALEALHAGRAAFQQNGATFSDYQTDRSAIQESGDGYSQQLPHPGLRHARRLTGGQPMPILSTRDERVFVQVTHPYAPEVPNSTGAATVAKGAAVRHIRAHLGGFGGQVIITQAKTGSKGRLAGIEGRSDGERWSLELPFQMSGAAGTPPDMEPAGGDPVDRRK